MILTSVIFRTQKLKRKNKKYLLRETRLFGMTTPLCWPLVVPLGSSIVARMGRDLIFLFDDVLEACASTSGMEFLLLGFETASQLSLFVRF